MMRGLCLILGLLACGRSAHASVVLPLGEADLVRFADTIVIGSVSHIEVIVDAQHEVRTQALVQVHRSVRGAPEGATLRIDVPGGELHGITHHVDGAPKLRPGQLALLFLQTRPDGLRPVGMSYGVFYIETATPPRPYLRRSLEGLSFAGNGIAPELGGDLSDFLRRLDARVARERDAS